MVKNIVKQNFEKVLKRSKNVAITGHMGPDPDSIFSCISMYKYLTEYRNLNAKVVYEGASTNFIDKIEYSDTIVWVKDIASHIKEYDTWIFLDGSEMERFTREDISNKLKSVKSICLDHHPEKPNIKYNFHHSDITKAGVAHLLGEVIIEKDIMDKDKLLNELILAGILGDTGGLKFVNKKWSSVLGFIEEMINNHDFQIDEVESRFSMLSKHDFQIVEEFLHNTTFAKHPSGWNYMYSYLSQDFINKNGLTSSDVKSGKNKYLFNYIRKVQDYEFGFTIVPVKTSYGLSFRSSPKGVNVNKITKSFNGGGHLLASGGQIDKKGIKDIYEAIDIIIKKFNQLELEKLN